ncbi:DUF2203 family protein [Salibacterium halotolerans]|uniref:DUF2203 family protein n=1 Tax=Salibacterium halotolerans TaxID=1884432 RepID=A0A1I5QBJ0_9BACI|nr:DUF2203 family protein [Salibacterium halotolerans]SFP43674.1 hypothetical protein SAMN05518683_10598 [Salibacterium halotolerans]
MFRKYFGLKEANAVLPDVREEMVHLQHLQHEYKTSYHHLQAVKKGRLQEDTTFKEDIFVLESAIDFMEIQALQLLQQLEAAGIYIKSIEKGIVAFPARLDGKSIFLSWKQGEEYISYYYEWSESMEHRRTIGKTDDD